VNQSQRSSPSFLLSIKEDHEWSELENVLNATDRLNSALVFLGKNEEGICLSEHIFDADCCPPIYLDVVAGST
jgi:hypothetical protein